MLGDTAVAVNPDDGRYADFVGHTVKVPFVNRTIPIIADSYVEKDFGTGVVKITPAHDPNDFEVGLRHNLEILRVMNDDGTMNEKAGSMFEGLTREEARKKVVAEGQAGAACQIEDYIPQRRGVLPLQNHGGACREQAVVCKNETACRAGDKVREGRRGQFCARAL